MTFEQVAWEAIVRERRAAQEASRLHAIAPGSMTAACGASVAGSHWVRVGIDGQPTPFAVAANLDKAVPCFRCLKITGTWA